MNTTLKYDLEKNPLDEIVMRQISLLLVSTINCPGSIRDFRLLVEKAFNALGDNDAKHVEAKATLRAVLDAAWSAENNATINAEHEANQIYNVLILLDANPRQRNDFIAYHCDKPIEWRFGGCLGNGGKFYAKQFHVDCYPEDRTPERIMKMVSANAILNKIKNLNTDKPR